MKNILLPKIEQAMFVDIPASIPEVRIPLSTVGIRKRPHYITIRDPFENKNIRLMADIKVSLNLPANQRGLHMSRIEGALHKIDSEDPKTLSDYVVSLCQYIKDAQKQKTCRVEMWASYELLVNKNKSKRPSHELINLYGAAELINNKSNVEMGIKVPFVNACPCTQRWGIKDFYQALKQDGYEEKTILSILEKAPLQAHTNAGEAALIALTEKTTYKKLYQILESSSPLLRELLSGEDEHLVVKEAHQKGMFCEDVMRAIIVNLEMLEKEVPQNTILKINVDVDESIHYHNLFSEVQDTLQNLVASIANE